MAPQEESRRRVIISLCVAAFALVVAVLAWGMSPEEWHGKLIDPDYIDQAFAAKVPAPVSTDLAYCSEPRRPRYRDSTLKTIHDAPVASLLTFEELKGEKKFEASDVIKLGEYFYAICDSSWAILKVHETQPLRSERNFHVGSPQHGYAEGESGFEGIFHDKTQDGMYVVREAVDISGVFPAHSFHAIDATAAARLRHRRDVVNTRSAQASTPTTRTGGASDCPRSRITPSTTPSSCRSCCRRRTRMTRTMRS